jgi:hypothetical protein
MRVMVALGEIRLQAEGQSLMRLAMTQLNLSAPIIAS